MVTNIILYLQPSLPRSRRTCKVSLQRALQEETKITPRQFSNTSKVGQVILLVHETVANTLRLKQDLLVPQPTMASRVQNSTTPPSTSS